MMVVIAVDMIAINNAVSKGVLRIAMPSFNEHFNEHVPCLSCI